MGLSRNFASALNRQRNPRQVADRQAAARERTTRLAGAAQQFLSPSLSGSQGQVVQDVGRTAAIQGLLGGAVDLAQGRTRTQFLAGNRLSGLQGLVDDFFNFAPRGVSRADLTRGPGIVGVLAQIAGLEAQFGAGGFPGIEGVANLRPSAVGEFLGRSNRTTLALPAPGLLGARDVAQSTPGTAANDLARRLAEGQGAVDTVASIRANAFGNVIQRAGLQGLDAPQSAFARDLQGREPRIVSDSLAPGAGTQDVVFDRIRQQNLTPRFGLRESLFPGGLQGLAASGLLPFGGPGASTLPAFFRRNQGEVRRAASDLFSPFLFGGA